MTSSDPAGVVFGGAAAQVVEVMLCGHVLDRIKVEQQVSGLSMRGAFNRIGRNVAELYRGVEWNVAQATVKGGCRWALVNGAAAAVPARQWEVHPYSTAAAIGAAGGATEAALLTCPMESLKVLEMTRPSSTPLSSILRKEGLSVLWRGLLPHVFKQSVAWATFMLAFQASRRAASGTAGGELSIAGKAAVGVGTGVLATAAQAPADVMKTLSQQAGGGRGVRQVLRQRGWQGLFAGLSSRLARHCTSTVVLLLSMDAFDCLPQGMRF